MKSVNIAYLYEKRVNAMDGKVLLFIRDYQLKRKIIKCIASLGVPFVECFEQKELTFKMQLFDVENRLYIHEFAEGDDDKQFENLKKIKNKGWKVIVIFPKYLIEYIDKSQEAKIDDLMVYPIEIAPLKNKIVTILSLPIIIDDLLDEVVDTKKVDSLKDIIQTEINRAERGKYALSFVMIDFGSVPVDIQNEYFLTLKKSLRETDIILNAVKKNTYILVCPFTPKNFLVEVENKIRYLFEEEKRQERISTMTKLYAYGLTLGEDGHTFNEIYKRLTNSIRDSKLLNQTIVQNLIYTSDKLNAYKMSKRF